MRAHKTKKNCLSKDNFPECKPAIKKKNVLAQTSRVCSIRLFNNADYTTQPQALW